MTLDYNQQRRSRNAGYGYGRQQGYGRPVQGGRCYDSRPMPAPGDNCGCQKDCVKPMPIPADNCGCQKECMKPMPLPMPIPSESCGCQNDCGCQNNCAQTRTVSRESDCGCRATCTYKRQKGCLEESSAYPVGMSYTPWQSWSCPYDAHRALMSGTIFPELDKPFCAAGRCGR